MEAFITSASGNPTPTIQALALYVAENLIRGAKLKNKEIFNDNDKRIIKEIMNIMVPENEEIVAAETKVFLMRWKRYFLIQKCM